MDSEGFKAQFSVNLYRARKRADLSQEGLGFRAEIHRTEVGLIERGQRIPRIDTLVKLAGALEVSPCDLLDGLAWVPSETITGSFIETQVPGLGTVHRRFEVERGKAKKVVRTVE